jgi:hypothetical protein
MRVSDAMCLLTCWTISSTAPLHMLWKADLSLGGFTTTIPARIFTPAHGYNPLRKAHATVYQIISSLVNLESYT